MALDPQAWDEVCRRRAAGESIRALADALGMSASTLARKLAASNAATTAPKKTKAARKKRPRPAASNTVAAAKPSKAKASPTPAAPTPLRRTQPTVTARRQLIARLYRAIDTKLKLMERRMNSEIDAIDAGSGSAPPGDDNTSGASSNAGRNSADHERETRAFGALVKTINSVRQMQAELDTIANAHTAHAASSSATSDADARLAADADRYRRDIAQRLAKFVPPQS